MAVSASDLHLLRSRFAGLQVSAYKQMGLRAIRTALQIMQSNPGEAEALFHRAVYYLPQAETAR